MRENLFLGLTVCVFLFVNCSSDDSSDSNTDDNQMGMEEDDTPQEPQFTEIPDIEFERALIELGLDDVEDGSVLTSNIDEVTDLILEEKGITDLTGIEDFTMLEGLWLANNELTRINVSSNRNLLFLFARDNNLTSVNVSGLTDLEKIEVSGNSLNSINVSDNFSLQQLTVNDNFLGSLDISSIPAGPQLNIFDVRNNPLTCIEVSSGQLSNIPPQWQTDPEDTFSTNCN